MYSTKFAQDRNLGVRFMRAFLKGVRDYNDAFYKKKGLDEVINLLVQTLPIKDAALYKKMRVPGINPNGQINLASLQADLDFFIEAGVVKAKIDLPKLIDSSFAETVVKELGPYK
jgi:NitT/TauT family transport system substrate-binding protein